MRILNYNDYMRNYLVSASEEKNSKACINMFNRLKENDDFSKFLAGILYEGAYLSYLGQLKFSPNDEELKENLEFLQEMSDVEEFIFSIDKEIFDEFCDEVAYFHTLDFYSKRSFVSYLLEHKKYLSEAFACFFLDLIFYLNKYDASIIMDQYYERVRNNAKDAFLDSVNIGIEELFALEAQDPLAYRYVVLDMIEPFYKYSKYSLSTGLEDDFINDIVLTIEEDINSCIGFSVNNHKWLKIIIEGYIKYNLLSKEDVIKIDDFFKEKQNSVTLIKVLKKCNKLKQE